nr:hypothetical protein [uncultured Fusobacterium sp.]
MHRISTNEPSIFKYSIYEITFLIIFTVYFINNSLLYVVTYTAYGGRAKNL